MAVEPHQPACMTLMPNEVLELIASQLVLSFKDVISLSLTCRRIHEATSFLVDPPLRIDNLGEPAPCNGARPSRPGLARAATISIAFTLSDSQVQSKQLYRFLSCSPRLRYLAISRPALDPIEPVSRWEPSRSKTSAHPFPLRSSQLQCPGPSLLDDLTHLELCDLSIHPRLLSRLASLTHLKLSVSGQRDAYRPCEVLDIISFAKDCKLVALEIGMHAVAEQKDRIKVVRACVDAWPELHTLSLFSVGADGRVPSLSERWTRPESAVDSARELATVLQRCPRIAHLSLGLIVAELSLSGALVDVIHAACPALESFRCLIPAVPKARRRPFVESYDVAISRRSEFGKWMTQKEIHQEKLKPIFGMMDGMRSSGKETVQALDLCE